MQIAELAYLAYLAYIVSPGIALIIGVASCFTNRVSPEDGMLAGIYLVVGGSMLTPVTNLAMSLSN